MENLIACFGLPAGMLSGQPECPTVWMSKAARAFYCSTHSVKAANVWQHVPGYNNDKLKFTAKSRQLHCEIKAITLWRGDVFFFFGIIGQEWHFDPVWPLTDSKPQNLSTPLHQQLASGQQRQCSVTIDYWRKCLKLLYRGQTREWMNRILCLVL